MKHWRRLAGPILFAAVFFVPDSTLADTLGERRQFFVDSSYDRLGRTALQATLKRISTRAYAYIDDDYLAGLGTSTSTTFFEKLDELLKEFDTVIYPRETAFFGSEPNPGIDRDPRVVILFESLRTGNGGYFDTTNLFPRTDSPQSNEREMIMMSAQAVSSDYKNNFLAHEFQHLISFNQKELLRKSTEEIWLNELRSEYAPLYLGYAEPYENSAFSRRVETFLAHPSNSLTHWPNSTTDYAQAALLGEYLAQRHSPAVISQTLQSSEFGVPSLDSFLKMKGTTFTDTYADWMVANYLNNTLTDARYGYTRPGLKNLRVLPNQTSYLSFGGTALNSFTIQNWQSAWLEYRTPPTSTASVQGIAFDVSAPVDGIFLIAPITIYGDGTFDVGKVEISGKRAFLYSLVPRTGATLNRGGIQKVVLAATHVPNESHRDDQLPYIFSTTSSLVSPDTALRVRQDPTALIINPASQILRNGILLKRSNEPLLYVIEGKYKRYLRPEIIALYGHLDPAKAIAVSDEVFHSYRTANYVRKLDDDKVYAVWPDGTKHWLHMSEATFLGSGRGPGSIFTINDAEFAAYQAGIDITR